MCRSNTKLSKIPFLSVLLDGCRLVGRFAGRLWGASLVGAWRTFFFFSYVEIFVEFF